MFSQNAPNVGTTFGQLHDENRPNWQNSGPRPIAWQAWYPVNGAQSHPLPASFFQSEDVHLDAPLAGQGPYPVVMLSHGTGGTAASLSWLAVGLARTGCVVLAPNHHGNTGTEPFMAEGFLCWWERALDISALLTAAAHSGPFAGHLKTDDATAIGFSLGGYTALTLMGARTSLLAFNAWLRETGQSLQGPREFPDAAACIPDLRAGSKAFRDSQARHGDDYTDTRFTRCVAIAPAPTVRAFLPASLAQINRPVTLVTGGADREAPNPVCSEWLRNQNPKFRHYDLGPDVGHYTFLSLPADPNLRGREEIFTDAPTVQRELVHACSLEIVAQCLQAT